MKKNYLFIILFVFTVFSLSVPAQDTIFVRIGINCQGVATVFSSTQAVLEGETYTVTGWQLPQAYSSVQPLYDALVGSNLYLEDQALNENIKLDWIIWNVDCSDGSYFPLLNGSTIIFNAYYIIYLKDQTGSWNPVTGDFYFQNGKKAVVNIKNSQEFQDFRLSAGIYASNVQFYFANAAGYDTTGLELIFPADTTDINAFWTLKAVHFSNIIGGDREKILTGAEDINNSPFEFTLEQNYPNPFNPSTVIEFSTAFETFIELNIYDLLGRKVDSPVSGIVKAGKHIIDFNAEGLAAGLYIYQLRSVQFSFNRKMLLLK